MVIAHVRAPRLQEQRVALRFDHLPLKANDVRRVLVAQVELLRRQGFIQHVGNRKRPDQRFASHDV